MSADALTGLGWTRAARLCQEGTRGLALPMEARSELETVFREHHAFVWRSVRYLGSPDPHDAVQETFLVVARRLSEFRGDASLRTWLFAICRRVVQTQWRQTDRSKRAQSEPLASPVAESSPSERVEAVNMLASMLKRLSDPQRVAYVLVELEGMTVDEAAEALQLRRSTLHSRVQSARKRMEREASRIANEIRRLP